MRPTPSNTHAISALVPVLLLASAAACSGSDPGGGMTSAMVELGTGTVSFEPLTQEQSLPLIAGPQGGHHFILHVRMWGLEPGDPNVLVAEDNPITEFAVIDASGARVNLAQPPNRRGYRAQEDGSYTLPSGSIVQVIESQVPALIGTPVRLLVRVTDRRRVTAEDEIVVIAVEDQPLAPDAGAAGALEDMPL